MDFEVQGKQPRGAPKKRWSDTMKKDLSEVMATKEDALDRAKWRRLKKIKYRLLLTPQLTKRITSRLKEGNVSYSPLQAHYMMKQPLVGGTDRRDIQGAVSRPRQKSLSNAEEKKRKKTWAWVDKWLYLLRERFGNKSLVVREPGHPSRPSLRDRESEGYDINWTTPFCVLTLRLTGLVMNVYDGVHYEKLKSDQKREAIKEVPGLLEIAAYTFLYTGTFVGPQFTLAKFRSFVNGAWLDEKKQPKQSA
ncbi:hypothetical protein TELCIR_12912 [Teladorsagia circumcincta]|uniref:Lysophospholipid acyltransferase 5 n=1 Tax=Teladorsagia circumcincta TaxID=45464 RepID=A0A2G9U7E9_TELCI|nr:hypothetical protein TELCIR_12912 [Teladorsagia circumcincta]